MSRSTGRRSGRPISRPGFPRHPVRKVPRRPPMPGDDPSADPSAIVLDGVSHRYGHTVALDGVSLTIPGGTATAVVGPDGVGKSTLLGLIAGVKQGQGGTIRVLGGDMASASHRAAPLPASPT